MIEASGSKRKGGTNRMISKLMIYVTFNIYNIPKKLFLNQLLKKTFEHTKGNLNNEENLCLIDKVINVAQLQS